MIILPWDEVEKAAILDAVQQTGSVVEAAKALGIGKGTIYRKLYQYAHKTRKTTVTRRDHEQDH